MENLRNEILNRSVKDIIEELEDALCLANELGDIKATVHYAMLVNNLNDTVDLISLAEKDT